MVKKLISLSLVLLLLIFNVACAPTEKPDKTVNEYLSALKQGDLAKAGTYEATDSNPQGDIKFQTPEQERIIKAILSKSSHQIVSSSATKTEGKVITKVTAPDMESIVSKIMPEIMSTAFSAALSGKSEKEIESMVEQQLADAISNSNGPMVTTEVQINLKMVDGKWKIVPNYDLLVAMTGNLSKALPNK